MKKTNSIKRCGMSSVEKQTPRILCVCDKEKGHKGKHTYGVEYRWSGKKETTETKLTLSLLEFRENMITKYGVKAVDKFFINLNR